MRRQSKAKLKLDRNTVVRLAKPEELAQAEGGIGISPVAGLKPCSGRYSGCPLEIQ